MIDDWPSEIVEAVVVRQHLEKLDDLYAYPLPEVGAGEDRLVATEAVVGALDWRYRTFLGYADGWRGLLQKTDLFGTAQLLGAPGMATALQGHRRRRLRGARRLPVGRGPADRSEQLIDRSVAPREAGHQSSWSGAVVLGLRL
jgi:hypothetical protein